MIKNYARRGLSLLMALLMVITMLPTTAFAVTEEEHEHCEVCLQHECVCPPAEEDETPVEETETPVEETETPTEETEVQPEYSEDYLYFQSWIDEMLCWYLYGSMEVTDELLAQIAALSSDEVADKVIAMNSDDLFTAKTEIYDLKTEAEYTLTNEEIQTLQDNNQVGLWFDAAVSRVAASVNLLGEVTAKGGAIRVTDTAGTVSVSSDGETVTATATASGCGTAVTNTVKVYNNGTSAIELSFKFNGTNTDKVVCIDANVDMNTNGGNTGEQSYSGTLAPGGFVEIKITSRLQPSNNAAVLTINSFTIETVAETSADVKFVYDDTVGTVKVGGVVVEPNGTITVGSNGASLFADPNNDDVAFWGWVNADTNAVISNSAEYAILPKENMSIRAVFLGETTNAYFQIGQQQQYGGMSTDGCLYSNLNDAAAAAAASDYKTVVPVADGTLPAGNYTIPSGVTLLVPMDTVNTVYTTKPKMIKNDADSGSVYTTPTAYRTLNMATGANITVNGAISVAGGQFAGGNPVGAVSGPVGFVRMSSGSKITVNNGAYLYAWGYVMGSGSVDVLSGGTVYESFQCTDWRGGQATSSYATDEGKEYKVFPLSQYYVQNVEVPMALYAGSREYGFSCVTITLAGIQELPVPFVGLENESCMFQITDGYMLKDFDEENDRQIFEVHGDVSMDKITMSMSLGIYGSVSVNSNDYVLPIGNNITVDVVSGTINITQDLCFLPGSKIHVQEGAVCNLRNPDATKTVNIYVYDEDEWSAAYTDVEGSLEGLEGFVCHNRLDLYMLPYAPGREELRSQPGGTHGYRKDVDYTTNTMIDGADAQIIIDGTINADYGCLYTTKSGAKVISNGTGKVRLKAGTATETYQVVQTANGSDQYVNYVAIPITVARLQNADGTYTDPSKVNTSYGSIYTYNGSTGEWEIECNLNGTEDGCSYALKDTSKEFSCINPKICEFCGKTETGDHAPGAAATCTTAQTCTECGTELEAALGHTEVTVPGKAATCYATGLSDGKKCSVCGVTTVEQTDTPMVAHTWSSGEQTKAPTCTETGTKEYYCTACQNAYNSGNTTITVATKTETVDALGHSMTHTAPAAATCIASGTEGYYTCGTCKLVFEDEAGKNPTTVADRVVAQLEHNYETTVTLQPTCTAKGSKTTACTYGCDVGTVTEEVAKLNHNIVIDAAVDPTCTETGLTQGQHCKTCDTMTVAQEVVNALGHTWSNATYTWATDNSTCTYTRGCERCGSGTDTQTVNTTKSVVTPATCTGNGKETYSADFDNVDSGIVDQTKDVVTKALGHEYTENYEWTKLGNTWYCKGTATCSRGCVVGPVEVVGVKDTAASVAPTCTVPGKDVYTATFTDATIFTAPTVNEVVVAATNHDWNDPTYGWSADNTSCTATRTCKNSNDCTVTETVRGIVGVTTEASCVVNGKTVYTAQFDGEGLGSDEKVVTIVAIGHNLTFHEEQPATCTETGKEAYWSCSVCSKNYQGEEDDVKFAAESAAVADSDLVIAKAAHSMTPTAAKDATCEIKGNLEFWFCSVCEIYYKNANGSEAYVDGEGKPASDIAVVTLPASDHNFVAGEVVAPTCKAQGYTVYICSNSWCDVKDGKIENRDVTAMVDHKYEGEWIERTPASCTAEGEEYRVCAYGCGAEETQVIDKLNHSMTAVAKKDATCTAEGNHDYWYCDSCETYYKDEAATEKYVDDEYIIAIIPHVMTAQAETESDCYNNGYYAYWLCDSCGIYYEDVDGEEYYTNADGSAAKDVAVVTKPLRQHAYLVDYIAPTCTEQGYTLTTCNYDGCPLSEQSNWVDATGHSYEDDDTSDDKWETEIAATCLTDGEKRMHCLDCDEYKSEVLPATGHALTHHAEVPVTCTDNGIVEYWNCSTCGNNYGEGDDKAIVTLTTLEVVAVGHNLTAHAAVASTCTTEGNYAYWSCDKCDKNYSDSNNFTNDVMEDTVDPADGHIMLHHPAVASDCITEGNVEYWSCSTCKKNYNDGADYTTAVLDSIVDAADGHNLTFVDANPSTCTADGNIEHWHCDVCDNNYDANNEFATEALESIVDEADGHQEVLTAHEKVAAECEQDGNIAYWTCDVCNTYFTDAEGENVTTAEGVILSKLGHTHLDADLTNDNVVEQDAATCEEDGVQYRYCGNGCGEYVEETIEKLGHDYEGVVTQPTCTEGGYTTYTCKNDPSHTYTDDEVPALEHEWQLIYSISNPSCADETDGLGWFICTREANATPQQMAIPWAHTWVATEKVEPTCTEDGHESGRTCSVCGEVDAQTVTLPALGHTYEAEDTTDVWVNVTPDTCTGVGVDRIDCGRCDAFETREVNVITDHEYGEGVVTDPTCTADGYTTYTCVRGDYSYVATVEDSALGHSYERNPEQEWIVDREATCLVDGAKHRDCTADDCDAVDEGEIPATQHSYPAVGVVTEPDCTTGGYTTYTCQNSWCDVVGGHKDVRDEVPALKHTYEDADTTNDGEWYNFTPDTCTEIGEDRRGCGRCIAYETRVVDVITGHSMTHEDAVEPNCETAGNFEYWYCGTCKTYFEDAEGDTATTLEAVTRAKLEHDFGEWGESKKDTCTEAGEERRDCKRDDCEHFETRVVDVITGHDYDPVVTSPTCGARGYTTYTCSRCSDSYRDNYVPQLNHKDSVTGASTLTTVTIPVSCTTDGYTQTTCSQCDLDQITNKVTASGHSLTFHAEQAASCTATGTEAYWSCDKCHKNFQGAQESDVKFAPDSAAVAANDLVIAKDEHTMAHQTAVASGCTTTGNLEYWYCSACQTYYKDVNGNNAYSESDPYLVPANGHALTHHKAVASGCTTEGNVEYWSCSVCDNNYAANDPVATEALESVVDLADGHNLTHYTADPSGCTTDGTIEYWSCTMCGENYAANDSTATEALESVVDPADGHNLTHYTADPSGCTTDGTIEYWSCTVCGNNYAANDSTATEALESIVDPADGHSLTFHVKQPATCITTGKEAYWSCSVCNKNFRGAQESDVKFAPDSDAIAESDLVIAKAAHSMTYQEAVAAGCTTTGILEYWYCATCQTYYKEAEGKDAYSDTDPYWVFPTGHTESAPVRENEIGASCTEDGSYDSVVCCSVCGGEISRTEEPIPAFGHTEQNIPEQPATCTVDGKTSGVKCSVCGETLVAQEKIPATGHTEVIDLAKGETCTEPGLTEGKHCDTCSEVLVAQTTIPAKGHTKAVLPASAASCTEDGLTEGSYCSVCGETLVAQEKIPATGHTEVIDLAKGETCTDPGLTEGSHCDVCGETLVAQEQIPATGHTEVVDEAVAPSCAGTGLTRGAHCSVCNEVIVPQDVIPALGHAPVTDPAVAATCTKDGLTEGSHCNTCEATIVKQEVVPAKGHTEVIDEAVAATCIKTGLTEGKHCSVCDEVLVAQETVEMLAHTWDEGRVTTLPTCTEEGVRTFTCGACNGTKTEAEPAAGHVVVNHEGKVPTYTSPGWYPYETCEKCDHNTMIAIPALGEAEVTNFDDFIENLAILETIADTYVKKVAPGKDPAMLVIKYIRTGVDRYNSGSWNIMAGYEDADFAEYVRKYEEEYNASLEDGAELMMVSGLKNIHEFYLPNGDFADIGHVFGSMDITYTNKSSEDHADVSGWAGDTVDLMSMVDQFGLESTDIEDMVDEINLKYFLKYREDFEEEPIEGTFSNTDIEGDLDAFYVMQQFYAREYENGTLTDIFTNYMTPSLTREKRAGYFLNNRLDGVSLRSDVRDAVYNEYLGNGVVATLEGTRPFTTENLTDLRKACCYVVADYLCKLAGDFVEVEENNYFSVFQTETSTLAPGIVQKINYAHTADGKTMVYYLATGDITQDNVHVYANYHNNDPAAGWEMQRVLDQANAAQNKYGNPEGENYIENYNVIASINGAGYDMHTGEPSGILVMNGATYHPIDSHGFFGILDDGTARIGTMAEFNALQAERPGRVREAIATFGDLIRDGEIVAADSTDRASRTAIGITATGKVVFMVLDGRQGVLSSGGNMREIAQIMLEAGCVTAVNLDGGGSSTYVAREAGETELRVVSSPSDGVARSVSTSLLMVSTAPDSSAFDRAVIDSKYAYFTVNSTDTFTATAVSVTGNVVDMPEGVEWAVSDAAVGSITEDGVFTASANGSAQIQLKLDGVVVGSKNIHVVDPDNVYFEKATINAIYGEPITLPVRVAYEGKAVAFNQEDVVLSVANETHGSIDGFAFTGNEACGLRNIKVTAALTCDPTITGSINLAMYTKDEASFDFDNASGGDLQLAWTREVTNSTMEGTNVYRSIDREQDMVTSYTFAMDMSQMTMPDQLKDLTYMLPGADMEGNNTAWSFLLQLAERVSTLTEVTPILYFDKNLKVDYSELSINNEYFYLKEAVFNEEENSLTLVMKWHRQEKPIDIDAANPMCIVTGITLTPKDDAAWNSSETLVVVNKGLIAYDVYLRANALYSFSSKPENQEIYGLYPFTNVREDGVQENGGHFESVYKEFEDQYSLNNGIKDGWVVEGGGFAFYENGEKYVGICEVEGYYYDFGDNGVNIGQKKYTGNMTDNDGNEFYFVDGLKYTGWMVLDIKNVRYYNPETGVREQLTKDEVPSTCLVDGHCTYISESGAEKYVKYDDAGGHEYVEQADGSHVCSVCDYLRIEMEDVTVKLSTYTYTYNGNARKPITSATAPDGRVLTNPDQKAKGYDYYTTYANNVDVGTASATLKASRDVGAYANLNTWRGNAAGSITVTYEIRPDLPKVYMVHTNGNKAIISWDAATAPDVTYVIYTSKNGSNWVELAETTELSYTIKKTEAVGSSYRIGTYKVVDGKTYESIKKTNSFSLTTEVLTITTGNSTNGAPTIRWTALPSAERYEVYRSTTSYGFFTKMFSTTGTSYTNTSAKPGVTYYYKVVAYLEDGVTKTSEVVQNAYRASSVAFDIVTGNSAKGNPTMTWTAIPGATYYETYRATAANGEFVKMFTTTGTSYTNTSAKPGVTYYYKVVAYLEDGVTKTSEVVQNTYRDSSVAFDIVTGNNAKGNPTMTWTAIPGATYYETYRATAANGEFVKMFTTTGTSYTNTSAKRGVTYYYKVVAYLMDGTTKTSEVVQNAYRASSVAFDIVTGNSAKGNPTMKWTAIPGATYYETYRATTANGEFVKMFTTTGTSYTNTSAKPGVTYYYKVVAYLEDGTTKTSEVVTNQFVEMSR